MVVLERAVQPPGGMDALADQMHHRRGVSDHPRTQNFARRPSSFSGGHEVVQPWAPLIGPARRLTSPRGIGAFQWPHRRPSGQVIRAAVLDSCPAL